MFCYIDYYNKGEFMNNNYKTIIDAGFAIEIRSQHSSMARAYLTKNGKRTGAYATFVGSHYNASVLAEKAVHTRKDTHIDRALAFLATQAK